MSAFLIITRVSAFGTVLRIGDPVRVLMAPPFYLDGTVERFVVLHGRGKVLVRGSNGIPSPFDFCRVGLRQDAAVG